MTDEEIRRALPLLDDPPICPRCGQVMTWREYEEQTRCTDCFESRW